MAAYNYIAEGIIQRFGEENISIPKDVSLICMDDIDIQPYKNMHLARIKMHLDVLSKEAVNLLYRMMEKDYSVAKQVIKVTRQFEEGDSIAAAR